MDYNLLILNKQLFTFTAAVMRQLFFGQKIGFLNDKFIK